MTRLLNNPVGYFQLSRTHYYGFISSIPLIILYTLFGIAVNWNSSFELKNGADVLIRRFFNSMGDYGELGYIISLNILVFSVVIYYRKLFISSLKPSILSGIAIEGAIWSVFIFLVLRLFGNWLLSFPNAAILIEQFYLSAGAGIYEEFLFRFILLSASNILFGKLLGIIPLFSISAALIISSLAFSGIHYIGELGDSFTWYSFLFRAFAGLLLGLIFIFRGFGIVVYTHFFYDILLTAI